MGLVRVLAIDPGPHVGIATWTDKHVVNSGYEGASYEERWAEWEETPERFYAVVTNWVGWADEVVAENFFISGARASSANATIEMIGVIRYECMLQHTPFVLQPPGEAKGFSTNDKLKRIGWWRPSKTDHARSATRHLLLYLANRKYIEASRLLQSDAEEV